jgi:hypothetical protein
MPRAARVLTGEQVYHVLNRGNGRATVFHKPEDFQAFVNLIREAHGLKGTGTFGASPGMISMQFSARVS